MRPLRSRLLVTGLILAAAIGAGASSASASETGGVRPPSAAISLPAVAGAVASKVAVRAQPRPGARVEAVMKAFRFDYRPTVFFVIGRTSNSSGEWFRVRVPGRPNGRVGWVRDGRIRLDRSAGPFRIVIDRSSRRLRLYRDGELVMKADVAVGTPEAPTPLGRFYVTAAFVPADDFLGPWAFETSAYAAISDWPRGGIVGLHGTSLPSSVGQRASHGCVRVYNKVILALKKRVRPGTPLRIRR